MKRSVTDVNPALRQFEASCFDGSYVTGDISPEYLDRVEAGRHAGRQGAEEEGGKSSMNLQFSVAGD